MINVRRRTDLEFSLSGQKIFEEETNQSWADYYTSDSKFEGFIEVLR